MTVSSVSYTDDTPSVTGKIFMMASEQKKGYVGYSTILVSAYVHEVVMWLTFTQITTHMRGIMW
jgi:hypothetical protein